MKKAFPVLFAFLFCIGSISCRKETEMTLEEIEDYKASNQDQLLAMTVSKPYECQEYVPGEVGGDWNDSLPFDPKTFNYYLAERDSPSMSLGEKMVDYLIDYDNYKRRWKPRAASWKIDVDEKNNTLTVHYTLRDDMYWTWQDSDRKVPVTADDVVWWYNEIGGDPAFKSSLYTGQFVTMPDGSQKHVDCIKTGEKTFDFVFPRIIADPLFTTNVDIFPSFLYKEAKEKGGVDGVKNLFSVACDVKSIPSCGLWYLQEYVPGQRMVYIRNPNYWQKDKNGVSIPYRSKMTFHIVSDNNTEHLIFKEGKTDCYTPTPEQLDDIIRDQADRYTVYNSEASYGASFWSFNQNPVNKDQAFYSWFTKKEFRQAMSCLLNRDRIALQVYRGLASPKLDFFAEVNPCYNKDIKLKYLYDTEHALKLLSSIGIKQNADGVMTDENGNAVEFDLTIPSSSNTANDVAMIISEECKKIGIKVNIRQTDFQKIVKMLTEEFNWQSVIIGLGTNNFPSEGSNVWPSGGNLHLWYPYQEKPATDWEARVDYLYNEASYTIDKQKAQKMWDEENRIILEQCPIIYLMEVRTFFALCNRWDTSNFYFDNKDGVRTDNIYLHQ